MITYLVGAGLGLLGALIYSLIRAKGAEALLTNLDTKTQVQNIQAGIDTDQAALTAEAQKIADEQKALAAQTALPDTQSNLLNFVNKKKDS